MLVNRVELAGAFGVSLPTLDKWRDQGMPAVQKGAKGSQWQFDLQACKAWREQRDAEIELELAAKTEALQDLQAELDLRRNQQDPAEQLPLNMREQYYRAEQKREDLARRRGFLVETAEVRRDHDRCFGYLSDRLQDLPDLLERHCTLTPEVVDKIAAAVDEWQRELALMMQQPGIDDDSATAA